MFSITCLLFIARGFLLRILALLLLEIVSTLVLGAACWYSLPWSLVLSFLFAAFAETMTQNARPLSFKGPPPHGFWHISKDILLLL